MVLIPTLAIFAGTLCERRGYEGEGALTDAGPLAAQRYELTLHQPDIAARSRAEFTLRNLPEGQYTFGFEFDGPVDFQQRFASDPPVVSLRLSDEGGELVFEHTAPVSQWTFASSAGSATVFAYGRHDHSTSLVAVPSGVYVLRYESSGAETGMLPVWITARSGGWK